MSFRSQVINFVSGAVGSGVAYTEVVPEMQNLPTPHDSQSLITAIVTVVGGLVSTILTNLFKRWFDKRKKVTEID